MDGRHVSGLREVALRHARTAQMALELLASEQAPGPERTPPQEPIPASAAVALFCGGVAVGAVVAIIAGQFLPA